jgi:hypothetical protein
MGTWGTALYSNDLAADLRDDFRDLIGDGLSSTEAVNRLRTNYSSSLRDADEASVFWLALADTGWRIGRLDEQVRQNALSIIDSGQDLKRWENSGNRTKREQVLAKLRARLLTPQPAPKHIAKPFRAASDWKLGEVVGFQLVSGRWVLLRVIGHHEDRGGRYAVCELLDWTGESLLSRSEIERLDIRREKSPRGISQFLFAEPRTKRDRTRILRTGIISKPAQKCGRYSVFIWPHIDRQFRDVFELE